MVFATFRLLPVLLTIAASSTCIVLCINHDDAEGPSVYFALMVSSAPTLNTSDAVVSAVDRALAVINNDSSILPEARLRYSSVLDTEVRLTVENHCITFAIAIKLACSVIGKELWNCSMKVLSLWSTRRW